MTTKADLLVAKALLALHELQSLPIEEHAQVVDRLQKLLATKFQTRVNQLKQTGHIDIRV